jgi:hypothetical protein
MMESQYQSGSSGIHGGKPNFPSRMDQAPQIDRIALIWNGLVDPLRLIHPTLASEYFR